MKLNIKQTLYLITFCSLSLAATWESIGLDSLNVNCLYQTHESIIAGTNKGLYFLDNESQNQWIQYSGIPSNICINDIVSGANGEIIVSAGNGSNSDGLYGGLDLLDGAPYYDFNLITFFDHPQAICYSNDTLMIGSGNSLSYAIRDTIQSLIPGIFFKEPKAISIPEYSFGVESPIVSDIYKSWPHNNYLVAGYDSSPEPGRGSLLSVTIDSNVELLDSSTTSIYEHFQGLALNTTIYIGGLNSLYKTVTDTYVIDFENRAESDFEVIATPNDQKVNQITGVMSSPYIADGAADLCLVTNDGIYLRNYTSNWNECGDIPAIPKMAVAKYEYGTNMDFKTYIYAATNKGVYRYLLYDSTPISINKHNAANTYNMSIKNSILKISTTGDNINSIELFNLAGQKISTINCINSKAIDLNLNEFNISNGTYFFRLKTNTYSFQSKFTYTK